MARSLPQSNAVLPNGAVEFLKKRFTETAGLSLSGSGLLLGLALFTHTPTDPSLNNATNAAVQNLMGTSGAIISDLFLQALGLAAYLPALALICWGTRLIRKKPLHQSALRVFFLIVSSMLAACILAAFDKPEGWSFMVGPGGVLGSLILDQQLTLLLSILPDLKGWMIAASLTPLAFVAYCYSLGLSRKDWQAIWRFIGKSKILFGHARTLTANAGEMVDSLQDRATNLLEELPKNTGETGERLEPIVKKVLSTTTDREPSRPKPQPRVNTAVVEEKSTSLKTGKKATQRSQRKLDLGDSGYELPPLELLDEADLVQSQAISKDALQQNAALLSSVLEDFGVKGEIVKVRPGPVVTLYELEPAPGTKTSRVIGLSDDIARSMSAISVRVAVVPGRNVIGIELPNNTREMVMLRELLASRDLEKAGAKLPMALGKDIGGAPTIVDLSRMPHLLIAGTTGSGKSVAVNTMILSLLYNLTPDQCRFIMIDPKMLELSVYDGIPHLLSPVVTEPGKAVVALKWAVREMEDRYRAMSQMGVRNIQGYNQRLQDAAKKGEQLTKRVQTGFDEAGKPVFEDLPLPMDPLPFIVVVVDEMADLMVVAGKDVEAAIQRLAQMARAAGIHLIMATQRPSVDVITGTIKANFPTRISFQVTSKIDSRTILGEQGAEQLLGQGDMLYMAGGGRITRVHGPFVSDEEVEDVVKHLKTQGEPAYLESVTEEVDDPADAAGNGTGGNSGDELYDEAVAIIAREGKASTSFIQRHLQIGYNRAARIIEQMEQEGVVSKADRVGRREVLVSHHGD